MSHIQAIQDSIEADDYPKLPRQVYNELAEIVGHDYIADDEFITSSNDWFGLASDPSTECLLGKPPIAVVLPSSTEEVAGIVKFCNKYKIKYTPYSTGYGGYSNVPKGAIAIDLRRMNKVEIDAESRMATIEPYVTAGQLNAEAYKHRLMCHTVGAGPVHSPLASAAANHGVGVAGNHTSINFRSLLAVEWVTPEGEIVQVGSCGSDAGWFTGEGPGPGFRGIFRGILGTSGGLGVFTKIGYKLYPWAGPEKVEWNGTHPQRGIAPPENFATYQLGWSDWGAAAEATHLFNESKCLTFITRTPPDCVAHYLTATNREHYDLHRTGKRSKLSTAETEVGWTVTIMAWSKKEFAWKESVLNDILKKTGGMKHNITELERDILTATSFNSMYVPRFCRFAEVAGVSNGILDSISLIPKVMRLSKKDIGNESKPGGKFLQTETEQNWMWVNEGRHFWTENNPPSTRFNWKSIAACFYFIIRGMTVMEKDFRGGIQGFLMGQSTDIWGRKSNKVNTWTRKTKTTWDPNNLSSSKTYILSEPGPESKMGPILKFMIVLPLFRPIMLKIMEKQLKG